MVCRALTPLVGIVAILASGCITARPERAAAVHHGIFLTRDEAAAVRARVEREAWAQDIAQGIETRADALVAEPLDIPHQGGQWEHYYLCKQDGAQLQPESPTRHVCPQCGAVYSGAPYDEAYITLRHRHWIDGLADLGQAYVITGNAAYAKRGRAILLAYAGLYRHLPWQNKHGTWDGSKARLFTQTLDEAEALCRILYGYDLLYDAPVFSPEDHREIARGLIRPMVHTIQRNDKGLSNWQAWHNAAVGCAGYFLNDPELVDWALNNRHGFCDQMRNAVTGSGLWYEGSIVYHFYALKAYVYLMEAAARSGMDLYGAVHAERLFRAPIRQLLPDATFAPLNDSDRVPIADFAPLYEVGYRRFGNPEWASYLHPRTTPWALFWGADTVPATGRPFIPGQSSNDTSEGLAVLRSPAAGIAALLEYGPGTAGHTHPAKLNLVLYADGDLRFAAPGRTLYGDPLQDDWYRQTVSHNTVVVDEASQLPAPARLRAFGTAGGVSVARVTCDSAYPGVQLDRTVFLTGSTLVDVVQCTSNRRHTFDLAWHIQGALPDLPPSLPVTDFATVPGYREIAMPEQVIPAPTAWQIDCGGGNTIYGQVFDRSEWIAGLGYGPDRAVQLPMILRRQTGVQVRFITVVQVLAPGQSPRPVQVSDGDRVTIRLPHHTLETGSRTAVTYAAPQGKQTDVVAEGGVATEPALAPGR